MLYCYITLHQRKKTEKKGLYTRYPLTICALPGLVCLGEGRDFDVNPDPTNCGRQFIWQVRVNWIPEVCSVWTSVCLFYAHMKECTVQKRIEKLDGVWIRMLIHIRIDHNSRVALSWGHPPTINSDSTSNYTICQEPSLSWLDMINPSNVTEWIL